MNIIINNTVILIYCTSVAQLSMLNCYNVGFEEYHTVGRTPHRSTAKTTLFLQNKNICLR